MSKEKAIDKITQAIFLIKPYFEGNLEAKRFPKKYGLIKNIKKRLNL